MIGLKDQSETVKTKTKTETETKKDPSGKGEQKALHSRRNARFILFSLTLFNPRKHLLFYIFCSSPYLPSHIRQPSSNWGYISVEVSSKLCTGSNLDASASCVSYIRRGKRYMSCVRAVARGDVHDCIAVVNAVHLTFERIA